MRKNIFTYLKCLLLVVFIYQSNVTTAQRQMEKLDRGLVAVQTGNGIFLSWRVFGTDPENIAFNIYRNETKVNVSPISGATNMLDGSGSLSAVYTVRPIIGGAEQGVGATANVWGSQVRTINLSNRPSSNHTPNDINVGDLDGDGQYELVVKWYPNNSKDNSQSGVTDNTYLAAYKLDGTFLWIIDLGRNIRSGAHYTQHLVGDYDSDGYAEVACKTAPGTRDGAGNYLSNGPASNDNDAADYRNSGGYVLSGPEYLTIFNGQTGEEMATVDYVPARGGSIGEIDRLWGDDYGNRVDRFNSTNACLDGVHTSMVFQRGYYTRMTMAAYDWDGQTLSRRWVFDSNNSGNGAAYGQGNHSIMAADIDEDGFDELLPGSCAIDHNGGLMWTTGYGHGDANHVGDFVPNSPGLEIWQVSENKGSEPDHQMLRASDGQVLWSNGSGNDNGRGMIGDIDARYDGHEAWSSSVSGTYDAAGNRLTNTKPASTNFRVYWDGDLQDELLNSNRIDKWNGNGSDRLLTLTGQSCNGTKATPNICADLLGDWREEVILHDGGSSIYIHTTTILTEHKLYTLMHDPVYRNAISWQQSSYNQPPHLGFWLGAGVENAPKPNIVLVGGIDCNGVEGGNAYLDQCNECVGGNTGKEACYLDCNRDRDGTASIDECGVCSGGNTGVEACYGAIQGENFCSTEGVLESLNEGFIGDGYLNFTNVNGSFGTWTIVSEESKTAELTIIYANGGTGARGMNVSVNGTQDAYFSANPTDSWTTWLSETIEVNLIEGVNNLTFTAVTSDGGPNVDMITFNTEGLQAGSCEIDCEGVFGGLAYLDSCATCVGGNTGLEACTEDCNGEWGGTAFLDNCERCVGGSTRQEACLGAFEMENSCVVDGIQLEALNEGFKGEGYANADNEIGAGIEFKLTANEAKDYQILIRYANGSNNDRTLSVSINDLEVISNVSFETTGAWTAWNYQSIILPLNIGVNNVRLEATNIEGLANLDQLLFIEEGVFVTDCDGVVTSLNNTESQEVALYPNPTENKLHLEPAMDWNLLNALGQNISNGYSSEIDMSTYPAGVYFIKTGKGIFKIVKK